MRSGEGDGWFRPLALRPLFEPPPIVPQVPAAGVAATARMFCAGAGAPDARRRGLSQPAQHLQYVNARCLGRADHLNRVNLHLRGIWIAGQSTPNTEYVENRPLCAIADAPHSSCSALGRGV